ncbi:hypothetical protein U1Q18_052407 [Sarracenia purpurea var. burkii]
MENILQGTDLIVFVDGSIVCPPLKILDEAYKEVRNPEAICWKKIDSQLMSCITGTFSLSIYTMVISSCKNNYEVWLTLGKKFTSLSRSHVQQLNTRVNSIFKKARSMDQYLSEIKEVVDMLAIASAPVDSEDLILIVLNGFSDEYNVFQTFVRATS